MIAENLKQVLSELPEKVRLVAVSKFHPNEAIEEAYRAGQRVFGDCLLYTSPSPRDCS